MGCLVKTTKMLHIYQQNSYLGILSRHVNANEVEEDQYDVVGDIISGVFGQSTFGFVIQSSSVTEGDDEDSRFGTVL